ncbi:MAG: nuclear transport factor 2 family protein [Haloglomus sp.]
MDDGSTVDAPVAPADPPAGSAAATVRAYYDDLRNGEPLYPYFHEAPTTVKFGVSERLTGYEAVAAGLREQTRTTADWHVVSDRLVVEARDCHAWFSDDVRMAWTDTGRGVRHEFDTRWSGTLERDDAGDDADDSPPWLFTGMHVSTSVEGR